MKSTSRVVMTGLLLVVAAAFLAKLVGLLILGWIAAMMAAKGAGMVAAALGPRPPG